MSCMTRKELFQELCRVQGLSSRDRKVAAGALSSILRNPPDWKMDEIDQVTFAVARVYHAPCPGWIPQYQATAVELERKLRAWVTQLTK